MLKGDNMKSSRIIYSVLFFVLLIAEIYIALFVNDKFIRPFGGDILVTVLLCAFVRIFKPTGMRLLPIYVFMFAVCVEILQYFDYVKLLGLAENRFFSVLMGRSFSVHDIVCYGVGCVIFFVLEQNMKGLILCLKDTKNM